MGYSVATKPLSWGERPQNLNILEGAGPKIANFVGNRKGPPGPKTQYGSPPLGILYNQRWGRARGSLLGIGAVAVLRLGEAVGVELEEWLEVLGLGDVAPLGPDAAVGLVPAVPIAEVLLHAVDVEGAEAFLAEEEGDGVVGVDVRLDRHHRQALREPDVALGAPSYARALKLTVIVMKRWSILKRIEQPRNHVLGPAKRWRDYSLQSTNSSRA